jgi:PKD repeat protein
MKKVLFWVLGTALSLAVAVTLVHVEPGPPSAEEKYSRKEERKKRIPKRDRMDLAIQQESELTRDPATNTVPKERLIAAYNYAEQLRSAAVNGRVAGAIPGMSWLERGPKNVGGRTRAIMVDPNDISKKTVWSAGVGGGLWKTTDITATYPVWIAINEFFANIAITALTHHPTNTQIMYFGTGEGFYNADAIRGNGIFKSTDGGNTWAQLASTTGSNFHYVQRMAVHPNGDVYAATRSGLFRSVDAGTTWVKVLGSGTGAATNSVADVEIAADNTIYAALGLIFSQDGVYKSATGAAGTWTKLNTGGNGFAASGFQRIEIACAPSNANVVYALAQGTGNGISQILRTTDGGANWSVRSNPVDADGGIGADFTRGQAWYDLTAAVDPNNENTLYVGGVDLFKTTNGGSSWQQIAHWYGGFGFQEVHADQHAIVFQPGNSNVIYFGNDGGIYSTTNGTAVIPSITHKSQNYNITQFYACAMNPTAYSSQFMAGAQDNGTQQYNALGINNTVEVTGGDGCFCHIDQDQPQYQFSSYVYNNYYRSTNGGASFSGITNNNTGSFVNPSDYDDLNNNLYACHGSADNYYVILNAPASGTLNARSVAAFGGGVVRHVAVSQNTSHRVFFGLSNGRIVRVDAANSTTPAGTNITGAGMPGGSVSCIAIQNGNDNHLLATYSNYGVNSVWETTNGGTTWTSVEGNIPDMPVRWALFNPANAQQAIVATELGVWSTDLLNGGATVWAPSNNGLANVRTDMLQIRSSDNLVIAATHGRGLFSSDVFASPYPDFVSSRQLSYTGKTINFTDVSYKASSWAWDFGDGTNSTAKNPTKTYTTPGQYTVTLVINGSGALTRTKTAYIHILPNRGIPYNPAAGGSFDVNALDFGAETIAGTPFERGNSAVAGKSGIVSGANAWVTGRTVSTYANNTDASLWSPNYNFTAPGIYTLQFYRKNIFEIGYDGFRVEYSLDRGDNWIPIGGVAANWYDFANNASATAFPINQPYFNGTRSSYTLCQLDVSTLAGNPSVGFRLRFRSDVSAVAAGLAIDNFEIIGPVNSPLPVELISFTGEPKGSDNHLSWVTLSEIMNERFDLERSEDGFEFKNITTIAGKGTVSTASFYKFTDPDVDRNYYYRLSQTDFNGTSKVLGIVLIKREQESGFVKIVYPNPFRDSFTIVLGDKEYRDVLVELFDLSGKKIYASRHETSNLQVSVKLNDTGKSSETLLLKVTSNDKVWSTKILRQ